MASNAKTKERKEKRGRKRVSQWTKMMRDIAKVRATGRFPSHYVGGGQPFTRGKSDADSE